MYILCEMKFGSHLYGTNTPESDTDYRGVFMPEPMDIYCGRIPKCHSKSTGPKHDKNTKEDIDREFYSLHYFIELACKGETVALDMLHAPVGWLTQSTIVWEDLLRMKHQFYTKNLTAFVGYARRQASKYGVKGSRLAVAKKALVLLERYADFRLSEIWDELWEDDYCKKIANEKERMWQVCGRSLCETANCGYLSETLRKFVENYGERARKAEANEGIDWKAVSHAFRAGIQAKHIFTKFGFTFPLPEAEFLKEVKSGKLHFRDEVAPKLDALMDELEVLRENSLLPEQVNRKRIDNWLATQTIIYLGFTERGDV